MNPLTEELEVTKSELVEILRTSIWKEDGWGNFKLEWRGRKRRLKIQPLSVRYEAKLITDWRNVVSDYYKNVQVKDGYLTIQSRRIPLESLPS